MPSAEDIEKQRSQLQAIRALLAKASTPEEYAIAAQRASSLAHYCANYYKIKAAPPRAPHKPAPAECSTAQQAQQAQQEQAKQQVKPEAQEEAAAPPPQVKTPPPADCVALFHNFPLAWSASRSKAFVERHGFPVASCVKVGGNAPGILVEFRSPEILQKAGDALQWQKPNPHKSLIFLRPTQEDLPKLYALHEQPAAPCQPCSGQPAHLRTTSYQQQRPTLYKQQRGVKRTQETKENARQKQHRGNNGRKVMKDIRDAVCPLWNMPYSQQLQEKSATISKQLERVTDEVSQVISASKRPDWCTEAYTKHNGRCCPLLGLLASPVRDGYRNKCEFTVGLDTDGKPCVGFLLGLFREGITEVADPVNCRHVPPTTIAYAHMTTTFLRQHSKLPAWDKRTNSGFWRLLTVREGRDRSLLPTLDAGSGEEGALEPKFDELDPLKWLVATEESGEFGGVPPSSLKDSTVALPAPTEVLLMLQVDPTAASPEDAEKECQALAAFLRCEAAKRSLLLPTVLLQQHHSGCSNAADPNTAPIMALVPEEADTMSTSIQEALGEFKFRLSATAFFQGNSPATCLLYRTAGMWASPMDETLLLDICCGTGTIGLTMARHAKKVVGVDCIEAAVKDAEANAKLNGITNCEYICAKVEDVIQQLLDQHSSEHKDVVVIVDPPRQGLHKNVLLALLSCKLVRRMVYISCNADAMANNLVFLCSTRHSADAFSPVKAIGVDLFPHTRHIETMVLLQR